MIDSYFPVEEILGYLLIELPILFLLRCHHVKSIEIFHIAFLFRHFCT